MTLGERIKKVRKSLDLTQKEFGLRIAIKQNSVAQIEMGRNTSEQTILAICKEFHVNETWLRTGIGDMFAEQTVDEELAAFIDKTLTNQSEAFRRRFVLALSKLNDDQWKLLETVALNLMHEAEAAKKSEAQVLESSAPPTEEALPEPSTPPLAAPTPPTPGIDVTAELAELRRQNAEMLQRLKSLEEDISESEKLLAEKRLARQPTGDRSP